jgi:hypothetical protein
MDFASNAPEIVALNPFLRTFGRGADSAEKWGEKSGDFYAPSSLKNLSESTY